MLLALLLLLSSSVSAQSVTMAGPFTGLNDTNSSLTIDPSEAQSVLNVEVSEDGMSLIKRKGYALTDTLSVTTSPITGSIYFKDPSGNNIRVVASDKSIYKSVNGAAFTAFLTTMTLNAKWDFCESGGKIYAFNSAGDIPWSWDGTTRTLYPSMPQGSVCAITPTRLLIGGTTTYPNRLYFSEAGVFTNFTAGTGVNDPSFDDIGLSGEKITALYASDSEWLIFKANSITSYQGTNQYDLVASVVSNRVGVSEPQAIVSHEGIVYLKGTDNRFWAYNAGNLVDISKKIETFTGGLSKFSATESKSYSETADWDAGTFWNVTSSRTYGSIQPNLYTYTDTTDADFNAGTVDPALEVSGDKIYVASWGPSDTPTAGYFANMGAESASTTNWTAAGAWTTYTSLLSTGPTYGSYFFGATGVTVSLSYPMSLYIKKYGTGETVYSKEQTGTSGLVWKMESISLDMSAYEDTDYYFYAVCGNNSTTMQSTTFRRGTITAKVGFKYVAGNPGSCYLDIQETPPAASSGTIISQIHTIAAPLPAYGYLTATDNIPTATTINYYIASSTSSTGTFSNWASTSSVWISTHAYYKWKAEMSVTTNTASAPYISDVSLSFQSTGYWLSDEVNMGSMNTWGQFFANQTNTGSGAWTYAIAVTTYAGGTATATYEALTSGAVMSVSTGTYARLKAQSNLSSGTETVRTDALSYSWNFSTDGHAHAFEYKGDIYFAVPYNYSAINNRLMKLDTETNGWTIFDIAMNRPMVVEDLVYFGSPTGGYIYKYPFGDSDNSSAINSYWKSKDFIGSNPYVEKQFLRSSMITGKHASTSLDVTYTLDTTTSTSYSVTLSTSSSFVHNNRSLPFGDTGKTINVQVGNNAANQPWSFYGISIDYLDKPWRVQPEE